MAHRKLPLVNQLKLPLKNPVFEEHLVKLLMARKHPSFNGLFKVTLNNKILNFICMNQNKRKEKSLFYNESLRHEEIYGPESAKSNDVSFEKTDQAKLETLMKNEILAAQQVLQSINSDLDSSKSSVSNSKEVEEHVHWDQFDYDWRKDEKLTPNVKSCNGDDPEKNKTLMNKIQIESKQRP
jgi:hypothetical protein